MTNKIYIWDMFYYDKDAHNVYIYADSFDEALSIARNINDKFCAGVLADINKIPADAVLIEK